MRSRPCPENPGKTPSPSRTLPGFVVNRILVPMINEAFQVLRRRHGLGRGHRRRHEGWANQPIGPLALADMIGLDVCLAVMEVYPRNSGDSKYRPASCCAKWWLPAVWGRKTGPKVFTPTKPPASRSSCARLRRLGQSRLRLQQETCYANRLSFQPPPEGLHFCKARGHVLLIGINRPAKQWLDAGHVPATGRGFSIPGSTTSQNCAGLLHAFGEHFTAGLGLPVIAEFMKKKRPEGHPPAGLVEPHDYGLPGHRRRTQPMVVAVKGICFTVGIELMLAPISSSRPTAAALHRWKLRRITPTGGATPRMPERAGAGNATLHLLTGDAFDAAKSCAATLCKSGACRPGTGRSFRNKPSAALPPIRRRPWWPRAPNVPAVIELARPPPWPISSPVQQRLANSEGSPPKACAPLSRNRPARFTGR